jgi:hypothetical protein
MGIPQQQPQQQQQPLLRKSRSNVGSGGSGQNVMISNNSNSTIGVNHCKPSPASNNLYCSWRNLLYRWQCVLPTLRNMILSLHSMDTLVGICFGMLLFGLLQALSQSTHLTTNPTLASIRKGNVPTTTTAKVVHTIAFAVSITGCGADPITEGAAVLQHSIHRASIHGSLGGSYDYQMYAIYHPDAITCAQPLAELGYTLLERNTPVAVADIRGENLRTKIESNGCCGEKELIKLEAYTLIDHPIAVHLDLDVLVLQPLDPLFDLMLSLEDHHQQHHGDAPLSSIQDQYMDMFMWPDRNIPHPKINALYTVDYNMVKPHIQYKPVQGGFLVLRPDMQVYHEFVEIIQEGDYRSESGWGGLVGPFYGGMTFQGIIPYYYNVLHPNQSIELNRCYYNSMSDNPRTEKTVNDVVNGSCRTGQMECQDCRAVPIHKIVTAHFTLCQKPWSCLPHSTSNLQHRLCRQLTHQWYKVRSELEKHWQRGKGVGDGDYDRGHFYGYCTKTGHSGYVPIAKPYGRPVPQQQQ